MHGVTVEVEEISVPVLAEAFGGAKVEDVAKVTVVARIVEEVTPPAAKTEAPRTPNDGAECVVIAEGAKVEVTTVDPFADKMVMFEVEVATVASSINKMVTLETAEEAIEVARVGEVELEMEMKVG